MALMNNPSHAGMIGEYRVGSELKRIVSRSLEVSGIIIILEHHECPQTSVTSKWIEFVNSMSGFSMITTVFLAPIFLTSFLRMEQRE